MENRISTLVFVLLVGISCQSQHQKDYATSVSFDDLNRRVNLDTCQNNEVVFGSEYIAHQGLGSIGETDTVYFQDFISVITAIGRIRGDMYYSKLEITRSDRVLFSLDSILGVGMYSYDAESRKLVVPIVLNQNGDNLSTESRFYLVNVDNGSFLIADGVVTNCETAVLVCNGKGLLFLDSDKLVLYNLQSMHRSILMNFEKQTMSTFKLAFERSKLSVYYFDNFLDYFDKGTEMRRAVLNLDGDICSLVANKD